MNLEPAVNEIAIGTPAVEARLPRFPELFAKTAVAHSLTYMLMGVIAMSAMNYKEAFAQPQVACFMRQFGDPWLTAGPLFQPLRGLIFALAFYPIRQSLFGRKHGWLIMSWLLVALGILGTFGPAGGSLEGFIYTITPIPSQMRGWLEVVPQAVLLSGILCYWINHPKRWLNWTLGTLFFLCMAMPVLGLLVKR